ncbi:MAG: helicase-associated domain-containing protein [Nocardia sp.]|nr:helicase-associated domain-containing protein [Nocardia sp.]
MTTTDTRTDDGRPRRGDDSGGAGGAEFGTLAEWLSAADDEALVRLLSLRTDLAVPLPASMTVLAARAEQRASVLRAADDLNTLEFAVLEALAAAGAYGGSGQDRPLERRRLHEILGDRVGAEAIDTAIDRLLERALIWGRDALFVVAAAQDALPWRLGATTELPDTLTEPEITAALDEIADNERALLDTLATTGPRGRTRDAAPDADPQRPVPRLLARRLLIRIDDETVELPPAVGQLLRGEPVTDPYALAPPHPETREHPVTEVNAAAAGEVGELLRHCGDILDVLAHGPAPVLRAGGLGVRELRRIAKQTGLEEDRAGLLVEVLAAARLLDQGIPDPPADNDTGEQYWAPTVSSDGWLGGPTARQWVVAAHAWLELDRLPWLIGRRDAADKPLAALSVELRNGHAAPDRRAVLGLLAEFPPGTVVEAPDVVCVLAWRIPRRRRRFTLDSVRRTLSEATAMGLLGRGALTSAGRALLHGTPADAEAEMDAALPEPVDHILVQADLTVIAPGPLVTELRERMALIADIESAGAATVYRVGEGSVRRALDAGMSAAELHHLFAVHSRTPVPQSLTYLIDDAARRHGRLRAGMAQSFIRSEDPALLAEVLAASVSESLALRAVAPTVAISQAPLGEVLERLRAAGFSPAGEDASGTIVDLRPRGSRISARTAGRTTWRPTPPDADQLRNLVGELRAAEKAARTRSGRQVRSDGTRTTTEAALNLLQLAVRVRRAVHIEYVDAQGVATERITEPVRIAGGQLEAADPDSGAIRHYALHRIASVALVEV